MFCCLTLQIKLISRNINKNCAIMVQAAYNANSSTVSKTETCRKRGRSIHKPRKTLQVHTICWFRGSSDEQVWACCTSRSYSNKYKWVALKKNWFYWWNCKYRYVKNIFYAYLCGGNFVQRWLVYTYSFIVQLSFNLSSFSSTPLLLSDEYH